MKRDVWTDEGLIKSADSQDLQETPDHLRKNTFQVKHFKMSTRKKRFRIETFSGKKRFQERKKKKQENEKKSFFRKKIISGEKKISKKKKEGQRLTAWDCRCYTVRVGLDSVPADLGSLSWTLILQSLTQNLLDLTWDVLSLDSVNWTSDLVLFSDSDLVFLARTCWTGLCPSCDVRVTGTRCLLGLVLSCFRSSVLSADETLPVSEMSPVCSCCSEISLKPLTLWSVLKPPVWSRRIILDVTPAWGRSVSAGGPTSQNHLWSL